MGFGLAHFALNSDSKQYKLAIVPIDFFVVKSKKLDGMNAFGTVSVKPIKRI